MQAEEPQVGGGGGSVVSGTAWLRGVTGMWPRGAGSREGGVAGGLAPAARVPSTGTQTSGECLDRHVGLLDSSFRFSQYCIVHALC